MTEILWHGRGGQGAFSAARILGSAYVLSGGWALAFPSFGPERRGAPMRAFTKLDSVPIVSRSEITSADYIVYLDKTLVPETPEGTVLIPTSEMYVLATAHRLPTVNTIMLGSLAKTLNIPLEMVIVAIETVMPERIRARNVAAVKEVMQ